MIMAAEKRKSAGGNNTPAKFAKNQQGKSPGGSAQGGKKFGGKNFGGQQNQGKGGSPQKQQQQNKHQTQKAPKSPKNNAPPPPPQGAKKIEVSKVATPTKSAPQQQQKGQKKGKGNKSPLNQVSQHSKNIHKKSQKKNRFQRFTDKLALNPRPAGACERALKAEQELGHGGRVYLVKVQDPPITEQLIKSWHVGIETAVFSKSVEPRQFLIIFKHDADVKKGVEALKKTKFAGSNITVEEKLDSDTRVTSNPDHIDPFCLYVTNIHAEATRDDIKALFSKCTTVTNPRKHNPKIGTSTKFCFVAFESANDALAALKDNYNATLSGNTIVMRFRRVSQKELKALEAPKVAPAKPAQVKETPKKQDKKPLKAEPEDSDEEDDDDDEDEEVEGKVAGAEQESDEDDDDDDEELGEEEDDDDDDDDDLDDDDEDDDDDDE